MGLLPWKRNSRKIITEKVCCFLKITGLEEEKGESWMFNLKIFLENEVKPALGCTEPGAVALAVARAREALGNVEDSPKISVKVSPSIYKNGLDVGVPGAEGARGNVLAAALGYVCGHSEYSLEVLKDSTSEDLHRARDIVASGGVDLSCDYDRTGVYVEALISQSSGMAVCRIEGGHSRIAEVTRNGETLFAASSDQEEKTSPQEPEYRRELRQMNYEDVLTLAEDLDEEDEAHLLRGVTMNLEAAAFGLEGNLESRLHLVKHLKALMAKHKISDDLLAKIRLYATAASEARMAGAKKPVMSSAGSGNHGITAILPVVLVGEALGKSPREVAKALCISHLSTSYVKARTGILSPICGCAVAAGSGAAAGIAWLLGGSPEQIAGAMKLVLANLSGLVCDGAKESCALKVGTASCEAYLAALMALEGSTVDTPQGLVDPVMRVTADDQGYFSTEGMKDTDRAIIRILETHSHY